jgi:peptidoglycan/xylan/chitin deacetylase (PgdA/CDA1 family)
MRKKRSNKKLVILLVISALIICSIFFIKQEKVISPNRSGDNSEKVQVETTDNQNGAETKSSAEKSDLKNISTPILMYHHIRDFNDPNDKIGTNLSVPPQRFAEQLDLIKSSGYTTITFNDLEKNNIPAKAIILTFDDGYKNFYENAYPELKKRGMVGVVFVITQDIGKDQYMSVQEIKEVNEAGIEIGSHTISHPDLRNLSKDRAAKEVTESKQSLESILSNKVISFCYPSGKFTDETLLIVKDAGYKYAVTTINKITTFENVLELNRYRVNNDTSIKKFLND